MKKILPLLLAISATSIASAQPTSPTAEAGTAPAAEAGTAPAARPGLDPAAIELLGKSAKAYTELNGLSMHFTAFDQNGAQRDTVTGDIAFQRPNKARLQYKINGKNVVFLSDGGKLIMQIRPEEYLSKPVEAPDSPASIAAVLQSVPSALGLVLPPLFSGETPLDVSEIQWQKAALLPDNGVMLSANAGATNPPISFRLYFDPTDNLLRRVEAELTLRGKKNLNITTISNLQVNPTPSPEAFTFTPTAGAKLVSQPTPYNPALKVGGVPIPLVGHDLSGKAHPWSLYRGKVVLLHFWDPRSPEATAEIPNILRNLKKYQAAGFRALGVALYPNKGELQQFIKANKITYPQLFDARGAQSPDVEHYELRMLPFSLLIGKNGKIAAVLPHGAALDKAIKQALQAK